MFALFSSWLKISFNARFAFLSFAPSLYVSIFCPPQFESFQSLDSFIRAISFHSKLPYSVNSVKNCLKCVVLIFSILLNFMTCKHRSFLVHKTNFPTFYWFIRRWSWNTACSFLCCYFFFVFFFFASVHFK